MAYHDVLVFSMAYHDVLVFRKEIARKFVVIFQSAFVKSRKNTFTAII